jgi:hypothetical protein
MEAIQTILMIISTLAIILILINLKKSTNHKSDANVEEERVNIEDELRRQLFQNALELVYRSRNKAKELVDGSRLGIEDMNELFKYKDDLIELMFRDRYFLERFAIFDEMHTYKNDLISFYEELVKVFEQNREAAAWEELVSKYKNLNVSYGKVISNFGKTTRLTRILVLESSDGAVPTRLLNTILARQEFPDLEIHYCFVDTVQTENELFSTIKNTLTESQCDYLMIHTDHEYHRIESRIPKVLIRLKEDLHTLKIGIQNRTNLNNEILNVMDKDSKTLSLEEKIFSGKR